MAKNNKHIQKKNLYERNAYNSFVSDSSTTYDETMTFDMVSLRGTKERPKEVSLSELEKPIGKPLHFAISDWCRKNIAIVVIIPIFLLVFSWILGNIIGLQIDAARIDERVIILKESIKDLDVNTSSKEKLKDEVQSIRDEIGSFNIDSDRLEKRIKYVEDEIDRLKQNSP